jgi:hypothetical protein
VASETVLGNGHDDEICDIVYVKPTASRRNTRPPSPEVEALNRNSSQPVPYLLIGFGRWGSSDPWLGSRSRGRRSPERM